MPPTEFKIGVMKAARALLRNRPAGFSRRDLADALGEDSPRLTRALKTFRGAGVLASGGRGIFVAGHSLGDSKQIGPGICAHEVVANFFQENGGMATIAELRGALDLNGDAERKLLARTLRRGKYAPLGGGWWLEPDLQWREAVLPGWRIGMAVRLDRGQYDLAADNAMRARISTSAYSARIAAGLAVEDLMAGDVGATLITDLRKSGARVLTSAADMTLSDWWDLRLRRVGEADALALTWVDFEEGRRLGEPWAGDAMSVEFWRTFATTVHADPVALSRGLAH